MFLSPLPQHGNALACGFSGLLWFLSSSWRLKGHVMARGDQLARQWRIIQTLISSKQGKSAADFVKDKNCHPRTIYRDLGALQEAGFLQLRQGA
jgi:hypothetical protein